MSDRVIEIMDTTLRDGEQTSGVSFSSSEKLTLAKLLLNELKVNRIEIASARVSEGEFNAVKNITKWAKENSLLDKVEILTFVDNGISINWMKKADAIVQNLLTKGSLNHLKYQLKKEPVEHFKSISKNISEAKKNGIETNVYLEDWSNGMRNSKKYVFEYLNFISNEPIKRVLLQIQLHEAELMAHGESYTKTPITNDKSIIKLALEDIKYENLIEDGTAIGMGLVTSVNRLKDSKAKSKIIILLTDGVNNSGFIDPKIATELAVEYGIKTYTIGLGSNGNARAPVGILPNGSFKYGITKVEIDEDLLKEISKSTGGIYFRATNNKKLEEIYSEINKLEKTEIEEFKYYNYQEKYRNLILISILFLFIEWVLKNTLFKSFI